MVSDLEVAIEESEAIVTIADLPTIEADSTQMRQLFQNLLSNSLKFRSDDEKPVIARSAVCRRRRGPTTGAECSSS